LFTAVGTAVTILTGIFLAKALGPYGKGLFSGVQVLQNGITAVTGGAGAAITYVLANRGFSIAQLLRPLGALLVAVTLLAWLILAGWGLRYGFNATVIIAACIVPASITLSWRPYLYMGLGRVKLLNYQSLALAIAILISIILVVVVFRAGITGALIAWSVCVYVSAATVFYDTLRRSDCAGEGQGFHDRLKLLVHFGSRSALSGLLGFLNYRVDSLVLMAYLGASGFGIYSVAVAAGELLFMIPRAVNTAASRDIGQQEFATSAEVTAKASRFGTFSAGALAILLALVAPTLIHFIYGARFDAAALPLRVLLPGVVAFAAGGTFSAFFAYQLGRPSIVVYVTIATIATQLGMAIFLVPRFGLVGAAASSTVTYLIAGFLQTAYFCKLTKLPMRAVWLVRRSDFDAVRSLLPGLARS
jgi:O-antigen/teichoic acid export membrane protein